MAKIRADVQQREKQPSSSTARLISSDVHRHGQSCVRDQLRKHDSPMACRALGRLCLCLFFLWSAIHTIKGEGGPARVVAAPSLLSIARMLAASLMLVGTLMVLVCWHAGSGAALVGLLLIPDTYLGAAVPWMAAVAEGDSTSAALQWERLLMRLALIGAMALLAEGGEGRGKAKSD